jgi:DNA-binding NarL/FixJ family response regulator
MAKVCTQSRNIDLLIIEDQGVMRALLRDFLQSNFPGLAIGEAGDGSRALTLVRVCRPRVILIDIHLPDANGIELTAQVKSLLPDTHVIVITNQEGAVYIERAHAAGALAYVNKQKILTELLPIVATALSPVPSQDRGQLKP